MPSIHVLSTIKYFASGVYPSKILYSTACTAALFHIALHPAVFFTKTYSILYNTVVFIFRQFIRITTLLNLA
jgi:hypothetical protein